jgi:hypothetical protein
MAHVIANPEMMAAAATDVATIGSTLNAAHTAAAAPTLAVMPAAADEVSAGVAHLFSQHAHDYQALAGQAAAFQEQFVQHLTASAGSYAATEAANAAVLQPLTASAGSFTSAIATLQGQILNLVNSANAALSPLLNSLTTLLTQIALFASIIIVSAFGIAFLFLMHLALRFGLIATS